MYFVIFILIDSGNQLNQSMEMYGQHFRKITPKSVKNELFCLLIANISVGRNSQVTSVTAYCGAKHATRQHVQVQPAA